MTPQTIGQHLNICAQEADVQIFYACESGSRAWGFPSPDSDFEVRFIYHHPMEWYLGLEPTSDTMNWFALNNELDFSGWDIRKVLTLFASCNLSLNEHLQSPITYASVPGFANTLREMIPDYFLPVKAIHHYFSQAQKQWTQYQTDGGMKIKRFFYIIRPLLACDWIFTYAVMPPTEFIRMLDIPSVSCEFKESLLTLIEQKRSTNERVAVEISPSLLQQTEIRLKTTFDKLDTLNTVFRVTHKKKLSDLNDFFLQLLKPQYVNRTLLKENGENEF